MRDDLVDLLAALRVAVGEERWEEPAAGGRRTRDRARLAPLPGTTS